MDEPVHSRATDPAEFEQALLPHRDAAYNLALWIMRQTHEAEDCVQEGYLRAYQSFSRFVGSNGRGWLLTIVRNVCYSRLRQQKRFNATDSFDELIHTGTVDHSDPAYWKSDDARALVPVALERLPPEAREILVLHEVEELPYLEIAAIVGIPIGTVMSRLSRARNKLLVEIQQLLKNPSPHEL